MTNLARDPAIPSGYESRKRTALGAGICKGTSTALGESGAKARRVRDW